MRSLLSHYAHALGTQIVQSASCNHFHSLKERISNLLLSTQDRTKSDTVPYTHDYLAMMLGADRSEISRAASTLQQAGIIRYNRGQIIIIDRPSLEKIACECYQIVKDEFDNFLGD